MKDDFYVGWGGSSESSGKMTSRFFLAFLILMMLVVAVFALFEKPFSDSLFEYGHLTEMQGELLEQPVISLRVPSAEGFEIIPLVGYGKMGPHAALQEVLGKGSFQVTLKGTLIQYKGNKLFELTEGTASLLSYESIEGNTMIGAMGSVMEVTGEIVDPKCFFGVMKPAYGKVHKSCAIRCISGQIPPILAIRTDGKFSDYYFLTDSQGRVLMQDLHEVVGSKIKVRGVTYQVDNWKSIRVEGVESDDPMSGITVCGP